MNRKSGRNGARKPSVTVAPSNVMGMIVQAGQRRATAPNVAAMPEALRTPIGQVPSFFLHQYKPPSSAKRKINVRVNVHSSDVTGGRMGLRMNAENFPSSQANTRPYAAAQRRAGSQK